MSVRKTKSVLLGRHKDTLSGLLGIRKKKLQAIRCRSRTDAIAILRAGYVATTTAGDKGAFTIHRDDEGKYHCDFMQFCMSKDYKVVESISAAAKWLKGIWPQLAYRTK